VGIFGRLFKRELASLVTCILQRTNGTWEATWVSDGTVPADFFADSLVEATDEASTAVASIYLGQVEATDAELQFAIYPWGGDGGSVILDITPEADGYTARAIQGPDTVLRAKDLDTLIVEAERLLKGTANAMFRWISRVSTIPT
jgi:hypothetical protein